MESTGLSLLEALTTASLLPLPRFGFGSHLPMSVPAGRRNDSTAPRQNHDSRLLRTASRCISADMVGNLARGVAARVMPDQVICDRLTYGPPVGRRPDLPMGVSCTAA
jgi:hypothetical protein